MRAPWGPPLPALEDCDDFEKLAGTPLVCQRRRSARSAVADQSGDLPSALRDGRRGDSITGQIDGANDKKSRRSG
jgi:hypothetical protein